MTHVCADCGASPAVVFLPEGRYLCKPCWDELRRLREYVVANSGRRRA